MTSGAGPDGAPGAVALRGTTAGVVIPVRVAPRARRTEVAGWRAGRLLVRVTAAPVGGEANDAARRLLASSLGVATGRVEWIAGLASRDKTCLVRGLSVEGVRARLEGRR